MFGCQQVLIHTNKDTQAIIEYLCSESNKVFNCAVYYARQIYFKAHRYVGKSELLGKIKHNAHFQAMYSQSAQQTCLSVWEAFKSFKELKKLSRNGELIDKPKPPKYRKGGLYTVSYPKQALKYEKGNIRIPLGKQVKAWFGIESFQLKLPSNLRFEQIRELRILPRNRCFYAEFVYEVSPVNLGLNPQNTLGIDPGMNNWLTCVSNVGTSFIIDGKHLKSLNRWYNKKVSTIKEGKPQGFWSKKLAQLTEKRNRQVRDAVNKAARLVVNHCLKNNIGVVVFGWNPEQKQEANLGRNNNQKWVQIPTAKVKERISQLCEQYGINFVETEESYTSQSSFVDGDLIPKYGEKPDDWKPSGKRVKRGLYCTAFNWYINADANAAANILRKVSTTLSIDLSEVSRVSLATPQRFNIWSAKLKRRDVAQSPYRSIRLESPRFIAGSVKIFY
ncbi:RNA-guided endonuclease InsQ/TnpB family protein [Aerosakkonemataceae cyanobacterium BLCC-F50]|uniref:RNA-guided endonuclease InsQ/TnpB family protein n=1 Tax=Floridaenema flaviceps BLCC-F50 TaxID=3153642 RepID=A0ABV4XL80_9CYAN